MMENTERDDLQPIVPAEFTVPLELVTDNMVLRPLRAEHNDSDHAAWTSSIAHIKATPGFGPPRRWPEAEMPLEENLGDLETHWLHFEQRVGFTYTVLERSVLEQTGHETVIGCVYIYDDPTGGHEAEVRSWVRSDRAELDVELWSAVSEWLATNWPFETVLYAPRSV
ncbi:MAG: N-acetyltransferase [Acidimicrobiales bacterium]